MNKASFILCLVLTFFSSASAEKCAICQDTITSDKPAAKPEYMAKTPCKHHTKFHDECLISWFRVRKSKNHPPNCPLCRQLLKAPIAPPTHPLIPNDLIPGLIRFSNPLNQETIDNIRQERGINALLQYLSIHAQGEIYCHTCGALPRDEVIKLGRYKCNHKNLQRHYCIHHLSQTCNYCGAEKVQRMINSRVKRRLCLGTMPSKKNRSDDNPPPSLLPN